MTADEQQAEATDARRALLLAAVNAIAADYTPTGSWRPGADAERAFEHADTEALLAACRAYVAVVDQPEQAEETAS